MLVLMKGTGAMIGLVITTGQEILKGEEKMWWTETCRVGLQCRILVHLQTMHTLPTMLLDTLPTMLADTLPTTKLDMPLQIKLVMPLQTKQDTLLQTKQDTLLQTKLDTLLQMQVVDTLPPTWVALLLLTWADLLLPTVDMVLLKITTRGNKTRTWQGCLQMLDGQITSRLSPNKCYDVLDLDSLLFTLATRISLDHISLSMFSGQLLLLHLLAEWITLYTVS